MNAIKSIPLVALVGRPNVGKSSIFNRMIGSRKALVRDEPGITRDRQYGECSWDGRVFRIADTGGLHWGEEEGLDAKVSRQAMATLSQAQVVVFVLDGKAGVTSPDRDWADLIRKLKVRTIYVVNKVDSLKQEEKLSEFYELGLEPLMPMSAETGWKFGDFLDEVVKDLPKVSAEAVHELPEEPKRITRIALIGRPNVGKSTLLNRLLKEERSIVDSAPGTTRDPVDSEIVIKGLNYTLVDTAGIRRKGRTDAPVEKFSIIKSLDTLDRADATFLLIDGIEGITTQDAHVAGEAFERGKALIFLVNKWDVAGEEKTREDILHHIERKLNFLSFAPVLFISAKTGKGLEKLFSTVERLSTQYVRRIPTGELNREFEKILQNHPLPVFRGKNVRIFYATQVGVAPPTFIVFVNEPKHVHFSYERYLLNALREAFGFKEVPVKIFFRKRD